MDKRLVHGLFILLILVAGCNESEEFREKQIQKFEEEHPFDPILLSEIEEATNLSTGIVIWLTLIPRDEYDDWDVRFYLKNVFTEGYTPPKPPRRDTIIIEGDNISVLTRILSLKPSIGGVYWEKACAIRYNPKSSMVLEYYAEKCTEPFIVLLGENKSTFLDRNNLPNGVPEALFYFEEPSSQTFKFSGKISPKKVGLNDNLEVVYELENTLDESVLVKPHFWFYNLISLDVNDKEIAIGKSNTEIIELYPGERYEKTFLYNLSEVPRLVPGNYSAVLRLPIERCYHIDVPEVYSGYQCFIFDSPEWVNADFEVIDNSGWTNNFQKK